MKVVSFREIEGYRIVTAIGEGTIDPEATKAEIAQQADHPADAIHQLPNYRELFCRHKVYFPVGPNQITMEDTAAEKLVQARTALEPFHLLSVSGEVIPNYEGVEYNKKVNGKWEKLKIERIGEAPDGPLSSELTPEQQEEIRTQEEEKRICCMTGEERAEALQREIDALADEAARLEKRKQIQGITFDPAAWYQEHEADVRQKYAVD